MANVCIVLYRVPSSLFFAVCAMRYANMFAYKMSRCIQVRNPT